MSQVSLDCSSKDQVGYNRAGTSAGTSDMLTSLLVDWGISIIGGP